MKRYLLLFILTIAGQVRAQVITGVVSDTQHEPIPGVTVKIKGGRQVSATDNKGTYIIQANAKVDILIFSAVNIEPLVIPINGRLRINATLNYKTSKLDEVQVIAYGTSTRRLNVGSVTKITSEDIGDQAISNPLSALQGRVPGLVVTSTSGIPGATVNLQVRGQNTLNPSLGASPAPINNPLYIIDGVPFATQNGNINQFNSLASPGISVILNNPYGGISPFNTIDPQDIESIEILKDADATAIYGSRGGNGVVLITTKKGKSGKTEFNLNAVNGISVIGHTMPMMNTAQYLEMRKEAFANDHITPNLTIYDPGYAPDLLTFDQNANTDWKKVFLGNTARQQDLNTSLSGGNPNTQFRIGGGYHRESYIFPGDYAYSRGNFLSSLHHRSTDKKLNVDLSLIYAYEKNNSSGAPNLLAAYTLEPNYPALIDVSGNLLWNYKGLALGDGYTQSNPFAYLKNIYSIQNNNLSGNLLVSYELIRGLTLKSSLGYNTFNSNEYNGNPIVAQNPANNPIATARFGNNDYTTWIAEPQIEYKGTYKKTVYSILIGSTFQQNENQRTELDGSGYINDSLIESVSGAPTRSATDSYAEYKYSAIFSRINVRWNDKYILDLNARRDGSSRFGPGKQFGNFGSVGAGWLFAEEPLIKERLSWLSYGKLRASYGIAGSDAIADYQYIARWATTNYSYQGNLGYTPQNLYNPDFSWASTNKLEIGLELGFIKDRILTTLACYRNRSGDQLITYQLPSQTGYNTVVENWNATVENSGVEFSLQSVNIRTASFKWNTSFNITLPQNKLIAFPDLDKSSYATTYIVGQSLSALNRFRYAGVNETTGIFQFYNAAGQLTYTPSLPSAGKYNDYANIGNLDPKFYGGLQNTVSYKNLQLDFFVEFKKQTGVNYLSQIYTYVPGWEYNQPAALLNRWRVPGDQTNIQQFTSQFGQAASAARDYFLNSSGVYSDASYIRLKTVTFSYPLPASLINKLRIQKVRIYATAQNLLTLTHYQGNDPETQNFYGVPPLRSVIAGLQLTL